MITGLNHITIAVKDLNRSFSFYHDVLDFTPLMKHENGAYFLAGDTWFCLDVDSTTRSKPLPEYTHFAFSVAKDNFTLASKKIREAGAEVWKDNKSEGESLYFLDPDGHKLEIHVGDWRTRLRSAKTKPWNDSLEFFESNQRPGLSLELLTERLAVVRLNANASIPEWALRSNFFSVSKTSDELSIVCKQSDVPSDAKFEPNWVAFKVKGTLEFGLTGVLASIAQPLAQGNVSIFAVSTFDTDYVLVKEETLSAATSALELAGHVVITNQGRPTVK